MRASDCVQPYPTVTPTTSAIAAARLLAGQDLPGLIVIDAHGSPFTVLAGTEVLRMALPGYCVDDPVLARAIDEPAADLFLRELGSRTVAEAIAGRQRTLPVVGPDATVLEMASLMAQTRVPLVAVVDPKRGMLGAVTLDTLLDRVLET